MKGSGGRAFVAVGSTDGGYLLSSNSERSSWRKSGRFLKGESVNSFAFNPEGGTLFAATLTEGVFRSENLGRTWKPSSRGLNVRKVWTLEIDGRSGTIYAGTHYGHLFRSEDGGKNWEEVAGLHSAPNRNDWGVDWAMGTTGLCVHTVKVDPANSDRVYIVASGNGTYRTDDGGETWKHLQNGVMDRCPVGGRSDAPDIPQGDAQKMLDEHLKQVHKCTHKIAVSAKERGSLYQQNHCGVFESRDSGEMWSDISPGDSVRHGFPMVLFENGSPTLFTVPAFQGICKKHNSCIKGQLSVYRRSRQGWEKLSNGLPKGVHTCVLRDGMTTDGMKQPGIYLGTTTGEVFGSLDSGDSWVPLLKGAGRIQGINSFVA